MLGGGSTQVVIIIFIFLVWRPGLESLLLHAPALLWHGIRFRTVGSAQIPIESDGGGHGQAAWRLLWGPEYLPTFWSHISSKAVVTVVSDTSNRPHHDIGNNFGLCITQSWRPGFGDISRRAHPSRAFAYTSLWAALLGNGGAVLVKTSPEKEDFRVKNKIEVSKSWGCILGSLYEGSYYLRSILGAPDCWKLPYSNGRVTKCSTDFNLLHLCTAAEFRQIPMYRKQHVSTQVYMPVHVWQCMCYIVASMCATKICRYSCP